MSQFATALILASAYVALPSGYQYQQPQNEHKQYQPQSQVYNQYKQDTPVYGSDSGSNSNWCQQYVQNPTWGGDQKPYGYENGKSCIARDGHYGGYKNGDDGSYHKSPYATPNYEPEYQEHKPSYAPYKEYKPSYAPATPDSKPAYKPTYAPPSTQEYKPSYAPSNEYKPSYAPQAPDNNGYHSNRQAYSCSVDLPYFQSTSSQTLIQCAAIACAPGQSDAYIQRALFQCHALEDQAKLTNNGKLPQGW